MSSSSTQSNSSLPQMHPISLKLDRTNYSFWKFQVLATARAYGFEEILLQSKAPQQYLESTSAETTSNPEYITWLRRDQFMFSWLLSSISPQMMGYIGRCTTAAQIWHAFETLFHSQSKARALQLRNQLQLLKKGASTIDEYILKFREISDHLFNIGQPISESDLISYILQGLGAEFESISVLLTSRTDDLTLHEVQFALQTHELRLQNQASVLTATVNQVFPPQANVVYHQQSGGRGGRSGRGSSNRGRGGGRFSSTNKPICQLCGKPNHVAYKCYKRFDVSFAGPDQNPPQNTQPQAHVTSTDTSISHYLQQPSSSQVSKSTNTTSSPSAFTVASATQQSTSDWYLDSGASAHVTPDLENIHHQIPYHGNESVTVGQYHQANSSGRQT